MLLLIFERTRYGRISMIFFSHRKAQRIEENASGDPAIFVLTVSRIAGILAHQRHARVLLYQLTTAPKGGQHAATQFYKPNDRSRGSSCPRCFFDIVFCIYP